MKYLNLLVVFFIFSAASAQTTSSYADFIQNDRDIKWCAIYSSYINVTPVHPKYDINRFYLNKFNRQAVRTYTEIPEQFSVSPKLSRRTDLEKSFTTVPYDETKMNWLFNMDEGHDASENLLANENTVCENCLGKTRLSFIKARQLLYFKNDRFFIRNLWLTPLTYSKTAGSERQDIRFSETLNLAFDATLTENNSIPSTAVFISRSTNNLTLLPADRNTENRVLSIRNWNLTNILRQRIDAGAIKVYQPDSSIYPNEKYVLSLDSIHRLRNPPVPVNVYDPNGEVTDIRMVTAEINYDSLYNYTLVQDIYFDFNKEKLYSKVIALIPRRNVITNSGIFLGLANYMGIYFPEKKKKIIPKKK